MVKQWTIRWSHVPEAKIRFLLRQLETERRDFFISDWRSLGSPAIRTVSTYLPGEWEVHSVLPNPHHPILEVGEVKNCSFNFVLSLHDFNQSSSVAVLAASMAMESETWVCLKSCKLSCRLLWKNFNFPVVCSSFLTLFLSDDLFIFVELDLFARRVLSWSLCWRHFLRFVVPFLSTTKGWISLCFEPWVSKSD